MARPVVLVPTMGALHRGHVTLLERARKLAGAKGSVVASIFVNPAQFGPREDLSRYPRPLARDKALCREAGVDLLFLPGPEGMYAPDHSVWINEERLSAGLCGAARPGHFRGVCTVVAKLFLIVAPEIAVFGEKDWQQLAVIRRMVRDLNFPVRIIGVPTVREADGLALSSRNAYLNATDRAAAPGIRKALLEAGERRGSFSPRELQAWVAHRLQALLPGARLDYVEVVDALDLGPVQKATRRILIAVALFLGRTRLIDNIVLK